MDFVSIVLVGLPMVVSLLLLSLVGLVPAALRPRLAVPMRLVTFVVGVVLFLVTTGMFFGTLGEVDWLGIGFNTYVFEEQYTWIESLGVTWHVGLDALSFPMVWLTAFLLPVTQIATWNEKRGEVYHPLILLMGATLIGVFVSLDLFMFYIFWELTLIPMFFLILKWGGAERRYAAQKFFIYTFTASVVMLLGLVTLYFLQQPTQAGAYAGTFTGRSFDLVNLSEVAMAANSDGVFLGETMQAVLFAMLMLGFLVKLPAAPFHTWLPDAHVQAPTGGSMLLAGVMLKMGAYGMFRIPVTLFPHALEQFQFALMLFGFVSLVYGAIVCLGQTNLKKMVAIPPSPTWASSCSALPANSPSATLQPSS